MTTLELVDIAAESAVADGSSRVAALQRLEALQTTDAEWPRAASAIMWVLVDSLLSADTQLLEAAADPLRNRIATLSTDDPSERELRGWTQAMLAMTRWGLHRLPSDDEINLRQNTKLWQFLECVWMHTPCSSAKLRDELATDHPQVSRLGRDLLARGLVFQRRAGREALWELTPRGRQLVAKLRPHHEEDSRERRASVAARGRSGPPRRAAGHGRGASSRRPARTMLMSSGKDAPASGETRYVLPHDGGGWKVAKAPEARAVVVFKRKTDAIARAKGILDNAGGGQVVPYDRHGHPGTPIEVGSQSSRKR
jgi:DNA-binding MarR family transcriptional regulator